MVSCNASHVEHGTITLQTTEEFVHDMSSSHNQPISNVEPSARGVGFLFSKLDYHVLFSCSAKIRPRHAIFHDIVDVSDVPWRRVAAK